MLNGNSVEHVTQSIGDCFSLTEVRGYYNSFVQKVIMMPELLQNDKLPRIKQLDGQMIVFPVAVFQYALGCYDLYISSGNDLYLKKFLQCARWVYEIQDDKGRWDNFSYSYPQAPYGAMAQGEGTSVLIRAYICLKDDNYLLSAQKAIDYMLTPTSKGGTSIYEQDDLIFAEYTHLPIVLNGWIFAWWGLLDYYLITRDDKYRQKLDQSCKTIIKYLPRFKNSYWSKYDLSNKITSPFYHNLHIAQMKAMYMITHERIFDEYAKLWGKQLKNPINKSFAFVVKALQKLIEKE